MDTKCIALAGILFVAGFGLGFAVNNMFYPRETMGTRLVIGKIEWSLEGDFLTMYIPIDNVGTIPVTIQSISVRENVTGASEYTDLNPRGVNGGSDSIAAGGGDTFEWNSTRGAAPFDFLLPGKVYVVKITVFDGYYQETTAAPAYIME